MTFSITNPGFLGAKGTAGHSRRLQFSAGTIEKRAKVLTLPDGTDTIGIKTCGYITLGFDHRVIDGAVADQFMEKSRIP